MRYILMRTEGNPPADKPVGMNNIVGIGDYPSPEKALLFMRPARAMPAEFTHFGLYSFPYSYLEDCKLALSERI